MGCMVSCRARLYWIIHTGCLWDRDQEMDEWVVWFYVEQDYIGLFTLAVSGTGTRRWMNGLYGFM